MNFLALSTFQTAALALLASGIIVALYFLKVRHRRVVVSSSVLWRRVLLEKRADALMERLRQILSVVLAIIIALLIVFAIARPQIGALPSNAQRVVIILDTSPTMLARTRDGSTRWQHAVASANSLMTRGTEVRVADTSGRVDSSFTGDREEIRNLIARMRPDVATSHFPEVNPKEAQIFFISDGVLPTDVPSGVSRVSVFEAANNVGITAFEVRAIPSTPDKYEAYLEVDNDGQKPQDVRIEITGNGKHPITRSVRLNSGESFKEPFDLSAFEAGNMRAAVESSGDAFSQDDVAYGYLPLKRKTRALLVTAGNKYLEAMLKLDSFIELSTTKPAEFRDGGNVDAYIFDRFAPPVAPSKPALIIGAANAPWLPPSKGTVNKPELKSLMEDHPTMQFVSLYDVSIERAAEIDTAGFTVIAGSEKTPLILAPPATVRPQWVMMTFDLQNSDFALHSGFPLFVDNVLAWFGREPVALHRRAGVIELPFANAQVKSVNGKTIPAREHLGHTVFEASEPGLYVASQGNSQQYVAVNFTNPQYSEINHSAKGDKQEAQTASIWMRHELWFYLMLGAFVLLVAEWLTYHRRITL